MPKRVLIGMSGGVDSSTAALMLLENGYTEITDFLDKEHVRHRQFRKNTITIEVHQFYAVSKAFQVSAPIMPSSVSFFRL